MVYVTSKHNADRLGHLLAMHLRGAHAHLRRRSNLVFTPFELSTDQYVLMSVLSQQREATQQELVQRCYSDTATIGAMLALLEERGIVTRKPHPSDGRAHRVKLTQKGSRLTERMKQASSGVRADLIALFNDQEIRMFMEFLGRLTGAMRPSRRRTATKPGPRAEGVSYTQSRSPTLPLGDTLRTTPPGGRRATKQEQTTKTIGHEKQKAIIRHSGS